MNFFCNIIVNLANDREVLSTSCCAIEESYECTDLITLLYRLIYDCSLDSIPYDVLSQYHHDHFEVLWIKARPFRLSRGFSSIIIRIVYHPPSSNAPAMNEYLSCQLSAFESSFPNTGTVPFGDFNKLNVRGFSRHFILKQLVNFPTRGNNILDLILTDLKEYYSTPEKLSSFGLSDHLTILLKPKTRRTSQETRMIRTYTYNIFITLLCQIKLIYHILFTLSSPFHLIIKVHSI